MRSPMILLLAGALFAAPVRAQLVSNPNNWGVTLRPRRVHRAVRSKRTASSACDAEYTFPRAAWTAHQRGVVFLKLWVAGGEGGVALMGGRTHISARARRCGRVSGHYTECDCVIGVRSGGSRRRWGDRQRRAESGGSARCSARTMGGERQIISCATCTVDPLKEKSGTFVEPFVVCGAAGGQDWRRRFSPRIPPACPPRTDDQGSGELGTLLQFPEAVIGVAAC